MEVSSVKKETVERLRKVKKEKELTISKSILVAKNEEIRADFDKRIAHLQKQIDSLEKHLDFREKVVERKDEVIAKLLDMITKE